MKRRVGIREVAEAAGVSITTVSHALNGKGRLPDTTRERVQAVAEGLGYRPNATARNLVGGKTGVLGFVVSQAEGLPFALSDFAYFLQLMGAATEAALARGYALVHVPLGADGDPFGKVAIDGAILVDPIAGDPLVDAMRARGVPVVTTGRIPSDHQPNHWVDNDHAAGARSMLAHLARRGARRIGLIATAPVTSYAADSLDAYEQWCAAHNMDPLIAFAHGDLGERAGAASATELLEAPDPPDAIYATLDRLALGVLLAAEAHGIPVPERLLVAGCTDSDASKLAHPPLTALNLHPEKLGHAAIEMLAALVAGEPTPATVTIPTRVLPRSSTMRRKSTRRVKRGSV